MEITGINAFFVMFKNYFTEFIISAIIVLIIITNGKLVGDDFPFNITYIGIYSLGSDLQELLF